MSSFGTKGVSTLSAHLCKLCKLPQRAVIEEWRVKQGLSHRQIHKRMKEELGIEVSLGTIAAHFKWVDAQVDEATTQEVRQAAAGGAKAAMQVFPDNVAYADKVLRGLEDAEGKVKRPQFIPYIATMLKERRESALGLLRYTPADPANKAATSLADIALEVAGLRGPDARPEA